MIIYENSSYEISHLNPNYEVNSLADRKEEAEELPWKKK